MHRLRAWCRRCRAWHRVQLEYFGPADGFDSVTECARVWCPRRKVWVVPMRAEHGDKYRPV